MAQFDWDAETYTEASGDFVTELELLTYIASGATINIVGIREETGGQYGPQWQMDFVDDKGEDKTKSFKKGNAERDGRLVRIQQTIEATGEPIPARFIKVGRRYDVTGA